jgi:transposase
VIQAFHCDGGLMTRRRYELTDGEWLIIAPLLPNKPRGVPRVDDRRVLNGILWRFRTGSPWAEIPERYGPSTTCYNRFIRWRKAGVWGRLLSAVSAAFEGEIVMIDSTCVRVHQHGATGKKGGSSDRGMGRSRGGLTSKIHALVDADGRPVALRLTGGQVHDSQEAEALLEALPEGATLLADKGYDSNAIREAAAPQECLGQHPVALQPQAALCVLRLALPAAEPCRALLQPHQALPGHRHSLRQVPRKLPRRRQTHLRAHLVHCMWR